MIEESRFNQLVDELLVAIEDAVDASGADIDYETAAGILTLEFADGSKVIVNRQGATQELWVAARSGGFHFQLGDDGEWFSNRDQIRLGPLLDRVATEQAGEPVTLKVG